MAVGLQGCTLAKRDTLMALRDRVAAKLDQTPATRRRLLDAFLAERLASEGVAEMEGVL